MKKIIKNTDLIILILSFFVFIFWMISISINVYSYMVTGALYELLALPTLVLWIVLPIIAVYRIFKKSFRSVLFPVLSILLILITILVVYFHQK